jgi:hypothetical protein
MIVAAPHRRDLQEASCVNKEIVVFNKYVREMVEIADYVKIIQADLSRNDFTQHGLHLNFSGKEKMAKLLRDNIQKLMSSKQKTTLIQKLEESLQDPVQKEDKEELMSRKKETPLTLQLEENGKVPVLKADIEVSTEDMIKDNTLKEPRTSKRLKRNAATRNEDFLW